MIIKTNLDQQEQKNWDKKQAARKASFLQSSWWGRFRQAYGDKVHYISDDDWAALVIEMKSPLGMFWLAPYGPVADSKKAMQIACDTLASEAKKAKAVFLSIEPQQKDLFAAAGFRRAASNYNPQFTMVNDLTQAEEDLMANMRQTNRSIVRKAIREGVTFERSNDPKMMELYIKMQKGVAERTGVSFLPSKYYQTQAELFMPSGHMAVEIAYGPDKKPLATAIVHDFAGKTTYTYAASYESARKYDAGRFLVFHSMIAAKKRGQVAYDLFGIAGPNAKKSDPWTGFTFFKQQFGGEQAEFAGTWDKPLQPAKYAALQLRSKLAHKKKELKQKHLKKKH